MGLGFESLRGHHLSTKPFNRGLFLYPGFLFPLESYRFDIFCDPSSYSRSLFIRRHCWSIFGTKLIFLIPYFFADPSVYLRQRVDLPSSCLSAYTRWSSPSTKTALSSLLSPWYHSVSHRIRNPVRQIIRNQHIDLCAERSTEESLPSFLMMAAFKTG